MTIATLVCLPASLCVNPENITSINPQRLDEYETSRGDVAGTWIHFGGTSALVDQPIAEVLRLLDEGPAAVTFAPEPPP